LQQDIEYKHTKYDLTPKYKHVYAGMSIGVRNFQRPVVYDGVICQPCRIGVTEQVSEVSRQSGRASAMEVR